MTLKLVPPNLSFTCISASESKIEIIDDTGPVVELVATFFLQENGDSNIDLSSDNVRLFVMTESGQVIFSEFSASLDHDHHIISYVTINSGEVHPIVASFVIKKSVMRQLLEHDIINILLNTKGINHEVQVCTEHVKKDFEKICAKEPEGPVKKGDLIRPTADRFSGHISPLLLQDREDGSFICHIQVICDLVTTDKLPHRIEAGRDIWLNVYDGTRLMFKMNYDSYFPMEENRYSPRTMIVGKAQITVGFQIAYDLVRELVYAESARFEVTCFGHNVAVSIDSSHLRKEYERVLAG